MSTEASSKKIPPIIGQSSMFLDTLEHTSKLAACDYPVIITGERGSGKELIAHRLHYLSPRWDQPFIKVNCAALTPSLLEAELFGHEPGAFTDAKQRRLGKFERAHKGSLFLDEIGSASDALQEKLLRAIEYGEIERLGGQGTIEVNTRILAASHQDLWQLAEKGRFRPDLLDRLAFDVIELPPLRQRPEDILVLAEHFAIKAAGELQRECFPGFTKSAEAALTGYSWPGNVRQLRNVVSRSVFHHDEASPIASIRFIAGERAGDLRDKGRDESLSFWQETYQSIREGKNYYEAIKEIELKILKLALQAHAGNQTQTAKVLGLSYHQVRGLLRKHHLLPRHEQADASHTGKSHHVN